MLVDQYEKFTEGNTTFELMTAAEADHALVLAAQALDPETETGGSGEV